MLVYNHFMVFYDSTEVDIAPGCKKENVLGNRQKRVSDVMCKARHVVFKFSKSL